MENANSLVVYWAPFYLPSQNNEKENIMDWNMLYYNPESVYDDLKKNINTNNKEKSFFSCPSFAKTYKNTYVFKNTMKSQFNFDENEIYLKGNDRGHINLKRARQSSLVNSNNLQYNLRWIFFSETPLVATFTPPYMHETSYTKSSFLISGEMDIGQWFRPYNLEFVTKEKQGELIFNENDPLFYVQFNTDKNITLKRFEVNEKLRLYGDSGNNAPDFLDKFVSLKKRYNRFNNSKTNEIILKEIKKVVI
jgi:hypothetical protein